METNQTETSQDQGKAQGFYAQPQAYLSRDKQYLTLVLPRNMIVRKHVNFFKAVMDLPFERRTREANAG
jgi:hypothetical protein